MEAGGAVLRHERDAVVPQPGAEVEDDRRLALGLHRDAARVAAVARELRTVARGRAPHAVERDLQIPTSEREDTHFRGFSKPHGGLSCHLARSARRPWPLA